MRANERILDVHDEVFAPVQETDVKGCRPQQITIDNVLSFGPGSAPLDLQGLSVVIGANGAGKSNLLEILDFLRCLPDSLVHT